LVIELARVDNFIETWMPRTDPHPFEQLSPDFILSTLDELGLCSDGRLLALNSYENRVYQVGMEEGEPCVVKFYRPGRWSRAAIEEEQAFVAELAEAELPVVAPLQIDQRTLFERAGFCFALYPRQGGRWPELNQAADRELLGRLLGRIHLLGQRRAFQHRPRLTVAAWAGEARRYLLEQDWIPEHLQAAYRSVSGELIAIMQAEWEVLADLRWQRLHGDCHLGNLLWLESTGPHFVDFDDCLTGPAIQDLWMLLSGTQAERAQQLRELLTGYGQFADFDYRQLGLIEILRTMRLMHYAAWLARRWDDPAFPRAFPWFAESKFWEQHVLDLREQLAAVQEPALEL
jgi:Ser/Thr protein kinase RdoA (MazF antagonist)